MAVFPSKKIIVIGLALLLGIGGWFFASKDKDGVKKDIFPDKGSFISALFKEKQKDIDGDGLADWEEALWKTKIDNSDTDGDGTSDGEEIKLGRNPAKPGPDDKMENPRAVIEENIFDDNEGLTKTDILARSFFANFMALQQSGNLNAGAKEQLAQSFLTAIEQEDIIDRYSLSDLKISDNDSAEILKKYGNNFSAIIKKYMSMAEESEFSIISRAMQEENSGELKKLDGAISLYQAGVSDLLALQAPKSVSRYHLALINSADKIAGSLANIQKMFDDPVRGLIGINQYQKASVDANEALEKISGYFAAKKVFFNENEDGYIFIKNRR